MTGALPAAAAGWCFRPTMWQIVLTQTRKTVKFLNMGAFSGANSVNVEAQKPVLQGSGYWT